MQRTTACRRGIQRDLGDDDLVVAPARLCVRHPEHQQHVEI
jgi:hypothetical protein